MSTNKSKMGSGFEGEGEIEGARGPKGRFTEEGFERVRQRVAEGEPVTSAVRAEGMGVSSFYERVEEKPEWWASLQKAREVKVVDVLEDELCRRVFEGEGKPVYWKGYQVGEERDFSDGLLMFLLKTILPGKYGNTKASEKRKAELNRKEQVFKKLLVDVQAALDHERRNETEILTRAGVPVPPRRYASAPVDGAPVDGAPVDGEAVGEEQDKSKSTSKIKSKNECGFEGGEEGGEDAETGRRGEPEHGCAWRRARRGTRGDQDQERRQHRGRESGERSDVRGRRAPSFVRALRRVRGRQGFAPHPT
jgi:hypothetical protein